MKKLKLSVLAVTSLGVVIGMLYQAVSLFRKNDSIAAVLFAYWISELYWVYFNDFKKTFV
ncbi:hypothetical protein [Radiobacillus sp. PE A8.2]|uniref:hypothetical protein n=1 Tax=Radiobacillus sp. PE A8.2 TaxID=3380349 RepID=UPI00388F8B9C